jgi:hypothetical protein
MSKQLDLWLSNPERTVSQRELAELHLNFFPGQHEEGTKNGP